MNSSVSLSQLTDSELVSHVTLVANNERSATARLVAALVEFDRRKLFLGQGCSSLFTYCTNVLHLSESAAYDRIEVARAAERFPVVVERLEDGAVTLTAMRLLAPILTTENHEALIEAATHKSKRAVELLVATLRPKADVLTVVRRLPETTRGGSPAGDRAQQAAPPMLTDVTEAASATSLARHDPVIRTPVQPATRPTLTPLSAERYKIQFTASQQLHDKLRRAQDLLRHTIPNGDPATIFERGLDLLLAQVERQKLANTARPRASARSGGHSRYIPAAVKREVWRRDQAQCAFIGAAGRCTERGFLELHHVHPYADGGSSVVAANIELRCRAHNGYEASLYFGVDDRAAEAVARSDGDSGRLKPDER